jgi:hypothetical protein
MVAVHDGTTGSYGMEFVTVPASLAFHKNMLEKEFFSAERAFHKRVMATDACGIHVHISKNAMNAADLRKLIVFINAQTNSTFINAMAGRGENKHCNRMKIVSPSFKGKDIAAEIVKKACKDGSLRKGLHFKRVEERQASRGDRYEMMHYDAVNIQNPHTVEIRIFKGSNDKNRVFRIMEFCEALVKFCRSHSPQQMTAYDFVEFVLDKTNKKQYPNLVVWLASKGMIGHIRKKAKDPKTGKIINKLLHVYAENKLSFPDSEFHKNKENYPEYYERLKDQTKTEKGKNKCA